MVVNPNRVGLAFGSFIALFHFVWAMIVALGLAQAVLNFIYSIHFLNNPFLIQEFNLAKALVLVCFTFVMGYIGGYVLSLVWNKMVAKR